MRRPFAVGVLGVVLGVVVALLPSDKAQGDGLGMWIKFLFPPQAGWDSACLSCGWHASACNPPYTPGPALDFAGTCTGTRQVYFRAFGFLPPGTPTQYVGYAAAYVPTDWACKEVRARVLDWHGTYVVSMRYVHTENPWIQPILLYANGSTNGYPNEHTFVEMTTMEKQTCIDQGYWQPPPADGVHVHEVSLADGNSVVFLRDGGDCTPGDRYPCAPTPYPDHLYYNPHDLGDSWARILCFDDTDCDGWTDGQESYVGTDSWDACPDNSADAAWPPDINNDKNLTVVGDVLNYMGRIGATPGSPHWWQRLDLNGDGTISVVGDVLLYRAKIGTSCSN
jgi:hypothetical protein